MTELKPCPFCGSREHVQTGRATVPTYFTFVECNRCGACVFFEGKEMRKDTIKAWNRRANDETAD